MLQGTGQQKTPMAAYPLYQLWANRFGTRLVGVDTDSPRVDFDGFTPEERLNFEGAGVPLPAHGQSEDTGKPQHSENLVDVDELAFPPAPGYTGHAEADGTLDFALAKADKALYPLLTTLPGPSGKAGGSLYRLSFNARFLPDPGSGSGPIGLGLMDARGWDATHSAIGVDGAQEARDWKAFSGALTARPDAPGILLLLRAEPSATPISGRLEVRNLRVVTEDPPHAPAYAALTSCAALSADGRTLSLIVFNKSLDRDIAADIILDGFRPVSARRWTVNGPSLADDNRAGPRIREVETALPTLVTLTGRAHHVFPAHSMTALQFVRSPKR